MNTESDIFSSPKSQDGEALQALRERLYPPASTFEELRKTLGSSPEKETSALERAIHTFQAYQLDRARDYLASFKAKNREPCLYYLNGWTPQQPHFLTEQSRKSTGGIFLRWQGKGIAINPGRHFLSHFHAQGHHIRDIDVVIVTHDQRDYYANVQEIYALNYELNKLSDALHIIHYYFHQKAFQDLSRILKPHFKQERHTLHSLELFVDSPDVEKIEVGDGMALHYFLAAPRDSFPTNQEQKEERLQALGICLELKSAEATRRIGYLSQTGWNPFLAHYLGSCDLLIAAFGHTGPQDYQKLSYQTDCLGYHGTFSLIEEMMPRLALLGEFDGREGDIRLEVVQKMREEPSTRHLPPIIPADKDLCVNLLTLEICCSISKTWTDPTKLKVVKIAQAFGPLAYLSLRYVY